MNLQTLEKEKRERVERRRHCDDEDEGDNDGFNKHPGASEGVEEGSEYECKGETEESGEERMKEAENEG
jgi:hypothetical protein